MSNIYQLLFFRFLFLSLGQILIFNNFLIFGNNVNIYLIFVLVFPLNFNTSFSYLIVFSFWFYFRFFFKFNGNYNIFITYFNSYKPYILKFVFGNFDINQVRKTSEYISKTSLFQKTSLSIIMFLSHQLIVNFIDIFHLKNSK